MKEPGERIGRLTALLAAVLGTVSCLKGLGGVHLFGDEHHSILLLDRTYGELLRTYDLFGSGIALPMAQKFAASLVGPGVWAYRMPACLAAAASLMIIYPVARPMVGPVPAALTAAALALNPMHVFYGRFGRPYAMMVLLSLILVMAVDRIVNEERPRRRWHILLALTAAALPWVHLLSAALVAAVGAAAVLSLLLRQGWGPSLRRLLAALAFGGAGAVLLYIPAREQLAEFLSLKTGRGDLSTFSLFDVASLVAGGRQAALAWCFLLPAAAILFLVRRRRSSIILLTAAFAPAAALLIVRPLGWTYAYARYLLPGVPFMLMLMAWLLGEGVKSLPALRRHGTAAALAAGLLLVGLTWLKGPLGPGRTDDGPFAGTYLRLMPIDAFDIPWEETPAFYRRLAGVPGTVAIAEVPPLTTRSVLLYRNYYLQHRQQVVDTISLSPAAALAAFNRPRLNLEGVVASGADYMVLHRDADREVRRYWAFVRSQRREEANGGGPDLPLLWPWREVPSRPTEKLASSLEKILGKPVYSDGTIIVWSLRQGSVTSPP